MGRNIEQCIEILSPHSDDAGLCLGGRILDLKGAPYISIGVTSIFTISEHVASGSGNPEEVTRKRKKEDQDFARETGCSLTDLSMLDAPLRGYRKYNANLDIRGDPLPYVVCTDYSRESGTIQELKEKLRDRFSKDRYNDMILYCPLGVGGIKDAHVDHMVTFMAVYELMKEKLFSRVRFYEDLPYATCGNLLQTRLEELQGAFKSIKPFIFDINMEEKRKLLGVYDSQIPNGWLEAINYYSASILGKDEEGKERHCERIWIPEL
jgi:LmbE family N-acetylglucosaminyl deacetylase